MERVEACGQDVLLGSVQRRLEVLLEGATRVFGQRALLLGRARVRLFALVDEDALEPDQPPKEGEQAEPEQHPRGPATRHQRSTGTRSKSIFATGRSFSNLSPRRSSRAAASMRPPSAA